MSIIKEQAEHFYNLNPCSYAKKFVEAVKIELEMYKKDINKIEYLETIIDCLDKDEKGIIKNPYFKELNYIKNCTFYLNQELEELKNI